jgi:23S rRNA G2069 N7-methylase RlmK/C1962 C5-methylase RlmI
VVNSKTSAQAEMLANRLQKRQRHLKKWARRIGTDVYRLYDRDIPEIPLVLDLYADAVSLALYKRPYEKDPNEERLWLEAMRDAAAEALQIPAAHVFLKERQKQRGNDQYERLKAQGFLRDIHEGGLTFQVNLSDYLDTGFFSDRRNMRALVRAESAGKKILNLFCYTASFSAAAAAGGAKIIDSVDLSNTYLEWGELNLQRNGFKTAHMDSREFFANEKLTAPCRFIRADALSFLGEAARMGSSWDLIVLDPPTFSNSKKMTTSLDIRRDYISLISRCLALLNPAGKLWFSTNAHAFRLSETDFAASHPSPVITDMSSAMLSEDLTGKKPPRCYVFAIYGGKQR